MMPLMPRPRRSHSPARSSRESSTTNTTTTRIRRSPFSHLLLFVIFVMSHLAELSAAQRDPVTNFCRRFGHQTAVIDRKLYIDGGFINYAPLASNRLNYTNTFLSYQDLDKTGSGGMPQLYANLSKNATVPSVNGGILWVDDVNKKFYLFGGEYYQTPPTDLALYAYDALDNYWETFDDTPQSINSVSYGAGASVSEQGEAYYYGGWLSNNSVPGWTGPRMATTGLIKYTMDTNQWTNITGPDDIGRAEGTMLYIPASDGGMLIYFGGVQDLTNGTIAGQPMDRIFVYDMASSRWYRQKASGDVPGMGARFCAGITWAADQSSYNIYLYGGAGIAPSTSGFDDVYILSLPSFTWMKMYPGKGSAGEEQYPHNTLSCNVIDGSQMIIIGGTFPLDDTTCDAPEQYGSHGLDLGEQNPDGSPWYLYRRNITSYIVPTLISSIIGGNPDGAATKTSPDGGFDAADLKVLMGRKYTAPIRSPTRDIRGSADPSPTPISHGAIAGVAVGGAVVLIAFVAGCWLCVRRRRRRKQYSLQPCSPQSHHSSHHTPIAPTGQSPWLHRADTGGPAAIPHHPVEMPETDNTTGHGGAASELQYDQQPYSAVSRGGMGGVSPYSATTVEPKYDDPAWPSPLQYDAPPVPTPIPSMVRYAGAGFGPSELSTDPTAQPRPGDGSPRHETYYHN
ncbi:hypothetical protein BJ170DRAFT_340465 [Xylariales sp. AK1849]|nr:hypothetical protein BJ170DRAFT_340465 [Xylariales sp. AK1849]